MSLDAIPPGAVTTLLRGVADGVHGARDALFQLVYEEVRRIAAARARGERSAAGLGPTELVSEAYLRLFGKGQTPAWVDRKHFYCTVALVMRRVVLDEAKRRSAAVRGGDEVVVALPDGVAGRGPDPATALLIDEALARLEAARPAAAEIFMLRHYAGMTHEEASEMLGIPPGTARRHWDFALGFLTQELGIAQE